jgi:hypothetical protein
MSLISILLVLIVTGAILWLHNLCTDGYHNKERIQFTDQL